MRYFVTKNVDATYDEWFVEDKDTGTVHTKYQNEQEANDICSHLNELERIAWMDEHAEWDEDEEYDDEDYVDDEDDDFYEEDEENDI